MALDLAMARMMVTEYVPHMREVGIEVVSLADGEAVMRLAYQDKLVGNPETGVMHGGALTVLIDSVSGLAVQSRLAVLQPIATLDLRIDYLKPATPGQAVLARAECYRMTRNIAFTRAIAHHGDGDDPIAHSAGTFALATQGQAMPT